MIRKRSVVLIITLIIGAIILLNLPSVFKYSVIGYKFFQKTTNQFKYTADIKFGLLDSMAVGKTDKSSLEHGFTEIYEETFAFLKNEPIRLCEIGIAQGGSLLMWKEYFPKAKIYGIDILNRHKMNSDRVETFVADQSDREQLQSFINEYGGDFDILIDDGGHAMNMQQISFGFLFKFIKPGGYYVIEDVHTSSEKLGPYYGAEIGGGNSTLTMIINFIRSGKIESKYLTNEECAYLSANIEYCTLFTRSNNIRSSMCIFKKKR